MTWGRCGGCYWFRKRHAALCADQALATYLEMEEEGKAMLAEIQNAIAILRDCA